MGGAFLEELVYDEQGQLLSGNFADYLIPSAMEMPDLEIHHMVTPMPFTPGGFKGVGEIGAIGPPVVLASAIEDALAPLGVKIMSLPLKPENIWAGDTRTRKRRNRRADMSEAGEGFKERATRELARVAAVFAAGEAEIADTYFNWDRRDTEKEVLWLTKQAGREIESTFTGLKEIVEKVGGDLTASDQYWVDKWGGDVDRNWLEENLWRTKQELNHGNLCVDIVEWLTGEPVDIKEVVRRYNRWTPDPSLPDMEEWVRLAEVFKEQEARQESWARLINSQGLLEGGSCRPLLRRLPVERQRAQRPAGKGLLPWCSTTSAATGRPTSTRSPTPSPPTRRSTAPGS